MSIEKLVQTLERQPKTPDQHWAEKREEWIADVAGLMTSITGWLRPAVDKGLVKVERRKAEVEEEDTGPYAVDALSIQLGSRELRVEPRGMRVVGAIASGGKRLVGARGRVELVSGPARATILRKPDRTWQLATVDGWPRSREAVPLDEETFTDAVTELLG